MMRVIRNKVQTVEVLDIMSSLMKTMISNGDDPKVIELEMGLWALYIKSNKRIMASAYKNMFSDLWEIAVHFTLFSLVTPIADVSPTQEVA